MKSQKELGFRVEDVRFSRLTPPVSMVLDKPKTCGVCSVRLGGFMVLHGVRVRSFKGVLSIDFPERLVVSKGQFKPVVTFLDPKGRETLEQVVKRAYLNALKKQKE